MSTEEIKAENGRKNGKSTNACREPRKNFLLKKEKDTLKEEYEL